MFTLLIYEPTYVRLQSDLESRSKSVRCILMSQDGRLRDGLKPEEHDDGAAQVIDTAFFSSDLFRGGPKVMQAFADKIIDAKTPVRWFHTVQTGYDWPIKQSIGRRVQTFTNSHEQAVAISEWVLWAGFDFFQGGPQRRAAQSRKSWEPRQYREVGDTHWLIVGFGSIGRESARRLRALGAKVTGVRRTPGPDSDADHIISPKALMDYLGEADAVLLCCPLSDDTKDLANSQFFESMKPESLFLNVGRGGLVDEAALLEGLDAGKPAYASLDVVKKEPLPRSNPLWNHPKVTLTAHTSPLTNGTIRRLDKFFLENLDAFVEGRDLKNIVPATEFRL